MLSIGAIGRVAYYLDLAREDYYLAGGEPLGRWLGRGAEKLCLHGTVERGQLSSLFHGFCPHAGSLFRLTQNAGQKTRQVGWDLTFSAPKSVSVLWACADEATRRKIQELHHWAVQDAIDILQDEVAYARRGKEGRNREPADLVIAAFEHGTSRALDPQLHTHCLVMNVGTRKDGTTGTILSKPIYRFKMAAGALYRASLAAGLERELRVVTERVKSSFEVRGVPKQLIDQFSKRRAQVLKLLGNPSLYSSRAAAFAALESRDPKDSPSRAELLRQWQAHGKSHIFTHDKQFVPQRDREQMLHEALSQAVVFLSERQAHFSARDLLRFTADASQGRGVDAKSVCRYVREAVKTSPHIVPLAKVENQGMRYTTRHSLELESRMINVASQLARQNEHKLDYRLVERVIAESKIRLSAEQAKAVRKLTTKSGAIQIVHGFAGAGKTTMLSACHEAWRKSGYKVFGVGVAGKVGRGLQNETGIKSDTLALRLKQIDQTPTSSSWRRAKQYVREFLKFPTLRDDFRIDRRTVVVVDEASVVGLHDMTKLLEAVAHKGGKIVLVGDSKQLQAISVGGSFAFLGRELGQGQLITIARQQKWKTDPDPSWTRKAAYEFARGDAAKALSRFAKRGHVHVAYDRNAAMKKLVQHWSREGFKNRNQQLILASTNAEVDALNALCQKAREQNKELGPCAVYFGNQALHVDDRILVNVKSRKQNVENGDLGTVIALSDDLQSINVRTDDGRDVTLCPNDFKRPVGENGRPIPKEDFQPLRLGYAMTVHKAQGVTVDYAYVLAGGSMQDRETSYVQATRARWLTRFFTDRHEAGENLERLAKQMSVSNEKTLAHEVLADVGVTSEKVRELVQSMGDFRQTWRDRVLEPQKVPQQTQAKQQTIELTH
jgi:conjugative relaxase-like TrwC/TraI family protein